MIYSTADQLSSIKNKNMRLLGIDYGKRYIGLAISDLSWTLTRALPVFDTQKLSIFSYLQALITQENIGAIVVGDPKHMNGDVGELCQKVHQFCQKLSHQTHVPITRFDERMTSIMAEEHMIMDHMSRAKRKEKVDSIAACYILQGFLDHFCLKALK